MARFYILTKTNWQGDDWKIASSKVYSSRKDAEAELDKFKNDAWSPERGIDIAYQVHARVFSRSQIRMNDNELAEALWEKHLDELQEQNPDKHVWNDGTVH